MEEGDFDADGESQDQASEENNSEEEDDEDDDNDDEYSDLEFCHIAFLFFRPLLPFYLSNLQINHLCPTFASILLSHLLRSSGQSILLIFSSMVTRTLRRWSFSYEKKNARAFYYFKKASSIFVLYHHIFITVRVHLQALDTRKSFPAPSLAILRCLFS